MCGSPGAYRIGDKSSTFTSYQPTVAIIRQMPTLSYKVPMAGRAFQLKTNALLSREPNWTIDSIDDEFLTATKNDRGGNPMLILFVSGDESSTEATIYEPLSRLPGWRLWIHDHLHM